MIRKNRPLLALMEELTANPATGEAITIRRIEAKQRLVDQDHENRHIYVIRSGIAKCFITEDNDKDYILQFLGEGELIGEIEAIRKSKPICSVEAITSLSVYTISKAQFLHYLQTLPAFSTMVLDILASRLSDTSLKGARQQLYTLAEILPQLLSALDTQHISFTKKELSEYLGISVRSLNRLLKTLPPAKGTE